MAASDYIATIGLEIHAELKTSTKMFCDSLNDPNEIRPNMNVCPVCMGYPGTLPAINKEAVRHVLRMGVAVQGILADYTEFDRKNYFYPDIPKGYQISQYKHPLVKGGSLAGVSITRIHLEEDTASSSHEGISSLVDYNRAGVPLMELVTEPVIHTAENAARFAKELQLLLQTLGASEANMEKGEMRIEANISISKNDVFGTKVEVKNLNSFKSVEKAIAYEIGRHADLLDSGQVIIQETRGWDEVKNCTYSQRIKEDSHDYRYFPDPDLPKLTLSKMSEFGFDVIKASLPELPSMKRKRYVEDFEIKSDDAEFFVRQPVWGSYFEYVIRGIHDKEVIQLMANYITSDAVGLVRADEEVKSWQDFPLSKKIKPEYFIELVLMINKKELSSRAAKDILKRMYLGEGDPMSIAKESDLLQKSDIGALLTIVTSVLVNHPNVVEEYKAGKESVLQFLVGQVMKESKGSANPTLVRDLLEKTLKVE